MLKENKNYMIVTSVVILIPIMVGLLLWDQLPDTIATHFGVNGEADGWSSKPFAVFGIPLFVLACHWIGALVTSHDPRYQNINGKVFRLVLWICPLVSLFCAVLLYTNAFEIKVNVTLIGELFVGCLFVVVGNYLPKCRQNYTVGIKLPWTLNDEENWNRTHRLAGWLWTIGGLLILLNSFLRIGGLWSILVICVVMVFVPTGYSFWYHMKHKN